MNVFFICGASIAIVWGWRYDGGLPLLLMSGGACCRCRGQEEEESAEATVAGELVSAYKRLASNDHLWLPRGTILLCSKWVGCFACISNNNSFHNIWL